MSANILLVGTAQRTSSLARNWNVIQASSGKQALQYTDEHTFDLIIVDAESMRTSGERICRFIKKQYRDVPMIHILKKRDITKVADITLYTPLSSRRLMGVINRVFEGNNSDIIRCGPFKMNPTTRILQAHGQEIQLNPKLAELLKLFFTHPNEILDRETIMRQVWDTNYMGDTRTLDVHIRHVRNVLENGNHQPEYLKTVRGVGYRLEIETNTSSP